MRYFKNHLFSAIGLSSLALLLFCRVATAASDQSILFGHNLTPTADTLPAGGVTVGNYALGVGLTDHITLATSPWLYSSYNMYSAIVKFGACFGSGQGSDQGSGQSENCQTRWGNQLMYLNTGRFGKNTYRMTALTDSFVIDQVVNAYYDLNFSVGYMYFFDETSPFSLRREPYNGDAYQWSTSILQNVKLPSHFGIFVETGMLGLNYVYPEIHIGLSMYHKWQYTLAQIGFSQTFTSGSIAGLFTTDQNQTIVKGEPGRDFSMHPEVQFQVFF